MPRSRSRNRGGRRDRSRRLRVPDSSVLIDLLAELDPDAPFLQDDFDDDADDPPAAAFLLLDAFARAAWSFHAGPGPLYAGPGALERDLARLRAREWFLFEFELPSGLTAAEEWMASREGQPGSASERRAVLRFLNSECGVFDVGEARPDGWMLLVPLAGGEPVPARRMDGAEAMLGATGVALPSFPAGATIAGRLFWRDDDRAELSAGACLVTADARARLLADPRPPAELRSGLALEAFLGADVTAFVERAADPCFPAEVDALLWAVSDDTFGYRRLWREVEGERAPVDVTRQLLAELDAWTDVEPQLLACAVAGAWLRRSEASANRVLTRDALAREWRVLEDHLRTALDTPSQPAWPAPAAGAALAISDDQLMVEIADLEVDPVEWIVDVRPHPGRFPGAAPVAPSPFPLSCAIVEQPIDPSENLGAGESAGSGAADENDDVEEEGSESESEEDALGEDEEDPFGDEDDEGLDEVGPGDVDEDGPLMLREVTVKEGEDEARVVLEALTDTLLAEGRRARPLRIVFRQRALAARLGDTLRDAGLDVALRCFDQAVEVATLEMPPQQALGEPAATGVPPTPEAEVVAFERLSLAALRAREGLDELAAAIAGRDDVALRLTLARPLDFPFVTLEGVEEQVGSVAVLVEGEIGNQLVRLYLAGPEAASRFDCRGPAGQLLISSGDTMEIEIGIAPEDREAFDDGVSEAGVVAPDLDPGTVVVPYRLRYATMPAPIAGRDLDVAAGVMEAVAAAAERLAEGGAGSPGALDLQVQPLGRVKIEWRGWR